MRHAAAAPLLPSGAQGKRERERLLPGPSWAPRPCSFGSERWGRGGPGRARPARHSLVIERVLLAELPQVLLLLLAQFAQQLPPGSPLAHPGPARSTWVPGAARSCPAHCVVARRGGALSPAPPGAAGADVAPWEGGAAGGCKERRGKVSSGAGPRPVAAGRERPVPGAGAPFVPASRAGEHKASAGNACPRLCPKPCPSRSDAPRPRAWCGP